jgi:DnaJ domain
MVLNVEDLQRDFGLSREESDAMRSRRELYSFMHEKRLACHTSDLAKSKKRVADSERVHYRTLACKEALKSGCHDEVKRREMISFFDELNDLGASRSFTHSGLKEAMIAERKRRYAKFKEEDRKKRSEARSKFLLEAPIAEKKRLETRERLKGDNLSHYAVLGIERDSSVDDIEFAFGALSILFHPDKCKDDDATEIFRKLQEAYEVLLCDEKRAAYDDERP